MKKGKKRAGGEEKKMLRHCFSTYFEQQKFLNGYCNILLSESDFCPIFRCKYPTMHRRIEKLPVKVGEKIDF